MEKLQILHCNFISDKLEDWPRNDGKVSVDDKICGLEKSWCWVIRGCRRPCIHTGIKITCNVYVIGNIGDGDCKPRADIVMEWWHVVEASGVIILKGVLWWYTTEIKNMFFEREEEEYSGSGI